MKIKSFIVLFVLYGLLILVSSTAQVETSEGENNADKLAPEEYHVTSNGYGGGGGGWGGFGGGGWGGPGGGGGWGGYNGGPGGGGWGGPGGGGGWGGRGRGRGGWGGGCRYGCCGRWYSRGGCSYCCRSLNEAIAFNEHEATP